MSNSVPADRNPPREARDGYSPHSVRLAWMLAAAYLLAIAYASLQPFRDWRVPPPEILGFLAAPWPRYVTLQDIAVNVAAYAPLGFLLAIGFSARGGAARGVVAAVTAGAALSLAMELLQMFLPARIASNVDLLANTAGALLGAVAAPLLAPGRIVGGRLHAARHRLFHEGMAADAGLVLVLIWLIAQFHPTTQPFGSGSLRATLDLPVYLAYTPAHALAGEAAVALFGVLGIGLLLAGFMRDPRRALSVTAAVAGAALVVKLVTAMALVRSPAPLAWLTPGVLAGLTAGFALLYPALRLPREALPAVAALCIVAATLAINVAPDNPYQSVPARMLARGASHFLNFTGIVRALSELWPWFAAGLLVCVQFARLRRWVRARRADPI
jgi:VanZ family protein